MVLLRWIILGRPIETHRAAAPTKARAESHPLSSIGDNLRDRFTELDLGTHVLKTGSQSFDLLLLLRDRRLEFGDCALLFRDPAMLFQELIERHRVHRWHKRVPHSLSNLLACDPTAE